MEILRLKGVPFSRLEVYKGVGGGVHHLWKGGCYGEFLLGGGACAFPVSF